MGPETPKGNPSKLKRLSDIDRTRVNQALDADETRYRQHSLEEAKTELEIFDKEINLFFELILFNEQLPLKVTPEDAKDAMSANVILMTDIFNCLRSAYKLLLDGYYSQLAPLLRRVNECLLRMFFFQAFPDKATLFLSKPKEWRNEYGKEERIRKELKKIPELYEITKALQKEYSNFSELTHANMKAMVIHMYPSPKKGMAYLSVGGKLHPTWLHAYARSLIVWTMLGLKVATRPYYDALQKLQPEWLDRAKELEQAIGKLKIPVSEFES
ncbi:hypothetical protein ES708_32737 [subsurface metagenome]